MKKVLHFFRNYYLFSIALIAGLAGQILDLLHYSLAANIVIASIALVEALPLIWEMWQDFRSGKYGIDILAATAIISSIVLKQYWASLVVVLMLTGGKSLEDFAERRAKSELRALLSRVPLVAHVIKKNTVLEVKLEDIKPGDKLIIKAGEVVPVDAEIIEGQSSFDESSITGEGLPVQKDLKAIILSGSLNIDGVVTAKAIASANDSQYQKIIKLVKNAASSQAPFIRLADKYSVPFSLASFAIAGAVWVLSGHAIRFLEVIIVATPCPLLLAAPIALISGMSRASRYGIIVKNGSALEKLASARTIAFDKTGTLTKGHLKVDEVTSFNGLDEAKLIKLAASIERNSNHVLAKSIIKYSQSKKIKLEKAKNIEEIAGRGIKASVKGDTVWVGGYSLIKDLAGPEAKDVKPDYTSTYIIVNGKLEGQIKFSDSARQEAKKTISILHKLGIKNIAVISGDNLPAVKIVADELGIDQIFADQLPADKLHTLTKLKPKPVVFVGDGINDAPVLTSADVGIAMGAKGSTAASESADMVIMLDDLSRVAMAVEIAKKTFKVADQSILIGIGLSFMLMAIFATGKFPPVVGAVLQEVVDVVSILNALRAHRIKLT